MDPNAGSQLDADYGTALAYLFSPPRKSPPVLSPTSPELDVMFKKRQDSLWQFILRFGANLNEQQHSSFSIETDCLIFHAAGTKGKGSTCALLSSVLSNAKYKTGLFTSPHLHTARERILINGNIISKQDIVRLTGLIRKADDGGEFPEFINFFDRWTVLALCYFTEQRVQAIVLETGLGGRYDTTNILPDNAVKGVLLTSISFDHQELLGDTLDQIAWQKAGIIKPHAVVVTTKSQKEEVKTVFRAEAQRRGIDLSSRFAEVEAPEELLSVLSTTKNSQFNVKHAPYQADNAALVWHMIHSVCSHLQPIQESLFRESIDSVSWPCRFETFKIVSLHPKCTVIIDGAHNEDSVQKFYSGLAQFASTARGDRQAEIWSLFGCGETRNWAPMVRLAIAGSDRLVLCKSKHYRAMNPEKLGSAVTESKVTIWGYSVREALLHLLEEAKSAGSDQIVIAVSGSLFIAAEARSTLAHSGLVVFPEGDSVHQEDAELPSHYK